jgi:putative methanogenesis marker protein 2
MVLDLNSLVTEIKSYIGITRKRAIADVTKAFPYFSNKVTQFEVLADFGEDAAVLALPENKDNVYLLAADGIMSSLLNADAYWAGYCSVLVNLHDIAAMGGNPIVLVDILSIKDNSILPKLTQGMNDACMKFGVPIVGGHIHPDSEFNAVDVAILGTVKRSGIIYSNTAKIGDAVIFAMDLDGSVHPKSKYSWDTTSSKSPEQVRAQLNVMSELGAEGLVHSGKDISNPGILGTLGMLLETSKLGAEIDLEKIPKPDENKIEYTHWLKVYQGCGFVVTCDPNKANRMIEKFRSVGIAASVSGKVIEEPKLIIVDRSDSAALFDFTQEKITGI